MPSKKKKYNARFPAGRIKKIMQSDEEIGKVAQAVPVIISIPRTLELFVESLLTKTLKITNSRNAKTLSPSHMKQCIMAENRFDFLRELVKNIPDISVAEEAVSNDSSPEATTIDPSDIPYDLSMPSTSSNSNNEISIQKDLSSNGTSSVIRNNGVTRSCGTTVVANLLKSHSTNLSSGGSGVDSRAELKRQWDVISRIQNPTTFASMSQSTETSTPPKLFRTDSAPAGLPRVPQLPIATTITSTTIQQHHEQQHQQPNPQLLPTDLRRLRHQPKSVPGNICSDIQTASQINHSKPQTQATAIPAPIVSIDFCNKPVVKIDYSNLALHDTNYSESISSSSSSPTVDQPNRSYINKAKLASPITTAPESPVINIDLSNIVTSGTFTASAVNASVTSPMSVPPTPTPAAPIVAYNKNSFLELDEDYDNI